MDYRVIRFIYLKCSERQNYVYCFLKFLPLLLQAKDVAIDRVSVAVLDQIFRFLNVSNFLKPRDHVKVTISELK